MKIYSHRLVIVVWLVAWLAAGAWPSRKYGQQASAQPAGADKPIAGGDWIGFHNGGPLLGEATAIGAPAMKLRWTMTVDDDAADAAPIPATHPATAPVYHAPGHFLGGAAIVGGVVYVGDTAGALRAIDAASGKIRWTYHSDDGFETTPLVLGGRVFIGDLGGTFHAVAADTGKKIWTFDSGGSEIHSSANYLGPQRRQIVFATDGADIFCLDAETGKQVWTQKAGDRVNGAPAISDGSVLVSGCDSQLRALSGKDGSEEFSADLTAICPGSTAVAGDHLVLGTDGGRVMCISAKTHQPLWIFTEIGGQEMVYGSPAIADGIVVVGARDRSVYGIDLSSGKKVWSYATRGDVDSSPAISGGRVYVGSKDKKLYVLDLKTGKELWSFTAGRGITAPPAIGDGVLVIGDEGGHLFCLE